MEKRSSSPEHERSEHSRSSASASTASGSSQTASAASSVKPPRKTESRQRKLWRSGERSFVLPSIAARSVRCRSGTSLLFVTRRSSPSEPCVSLERICSGVSTWARPAASARASGIPSSRRTSSARPFAFARVTWKSGRTARARSTKSRTLASSARLSGVSLPPGVASGTTASSRSPSRPRRWREVTRHESEPARSRSVRIAPAPSTSCSKLSRTRSAGPCPRRSAIRTSGSPPRARWRTEAIASGTSRASATWESGTNQTSPL